MEERYNCSMSFNKATILGVGLIGASLALALREKGLCRVLYGYGRDEENLKRAKALGIIDAYSMDAASACREADLVVFATPVGAFKKLAGVLGGSLKKGAVVTDVGSVKGDLVYELEALMPAGVNYVGSHPIAGSDKSGIDDAKPGLFRKALCIITPTENSDKDAVQKIAGLWSAVGGRVESMDAYEHDRIYAAVSHFPHLLAYEIVNAAAEADRSYLSYAGRGFKDTTRIASSSPELWRDICMFNGEDIVRLIDIFIARLETVRGYIAGSDADSLEKEFIKAKLLRDGIGKD